MQIKKKNADIEFLRFFMILAVIILHFSEDYVGIPGILKGGYLGVDFFFILSGFFLKKHFDNDNSSLGPFDKSQKYLWYRVKQLWLPYITAIFLYVGTLFIENHLNVKWLIQHLWETKWQYLFLHYLGAPVGFEFRSIWFMSALVILSYFIYFLLCYNEEFYLGLIPVLIIIIYVWIYVSYGTLAMQEIYRGILHGSMIRGFACMSLGVLAYKLSERISSGEISVEFKCPQGLKIMCFILVLYVMRKYGLDQNDFAVLPAMFLMTILSYLFPADLPMMIKKVLLYLGDISYWIYVLHLLISKWFVLFFPGKSYNVMLPLFIIATIIVSSLLSLLFKAGFYKTLKINGK